MADKQEKSELHPRNKNRSRYDLEKMVVMTPELKSHLQSNKKGNLSINFSDPIAVRVLNKAILQHYYGINEWEFPKEHLCPPVPGRADYIHHIADVLSQDQNGRLPKEKQITCLDIGTGASCIYPIIGVTEYGWSFIASDIDRKAIKSAKRIVHANTILQNKVDFRLQSQPDHIFKNILKPTERIELSICNPPFHASLEEARKGTRRKVKNLTGRSSKQPKLNFSGNQNELIYPGGEYQFINNMIVESRIFAKQCLWFSTLVSKESNLKKLYRTAKQQKPAALDVIPISTSNKTSRLLIWSYIGKKGRKDWLERYSQLWK